jgi:TRAP-type C4-dicarboxylate transport system permease small subunit
MTAPSDRGLKTINAIASVLLACAVVLMAVQVVLRFVFSQPQPWAEEINRYCFVWATFLGSVIALAKGTHIRVTVLIDRLGPVGRARADLLDRVVCMVVFAFVAWFGFVNVWGWRNQTFFTLPSIPQAVFSLAAPVGATLMCLYLLRRPGRPDAQAEAIPPTP